MKNSLVSIIIVCLNAEKTIGKAIESVLSQTYQNIECIIIDGISKDKTIDIIDSYKTEKIHLISEKDKGIYDAMNKGINNSKGEWLYFLGADDELLPNAIQIFIQYSQNCDIIYGNYIINFSNNHEKFMKSIDYNVIPYKVFTNHQSVLMKREVFETFNGFDVTYKIVADFDLIQKAFLKGYVFKQINETIAKFSSGGISSSNFNTTIEWYNVCKNNKSIKYPIIALLYGISRDIKNRIVNFKSKRD